MAPVREAVKVDLLPSPTSLPLSQKTTSSPHLPRLLLASKIFFFFPLFLFFFSLQATHWKRVPRNASYAVTPCVPQEQYSFKVLSPLLSPLISSYLLSSSHPLILSSSHPLILHPLILSSSLIFSSSPSHLSSFISLSSIILICLSPLTSSLLTCSLGFTDGPSPRCDSIA